MSTPEARAQCFGTLTEVVHALYAACGWLDENPEQHLRLHLPEDAAGWISRLQEPRLQVVCGKPDRTAIDLSVLDVGPTPPALLMARLLGCSTTSPRRPAFDKVISDWSATGSTIMSVMGLPPEFRRRLLHHNWGTPVVCVDSDVLVDQPAVYCWRAQDTSDTRLFDAVNNARLVIAGENRALDFAVLTGTPWVGLFSRSHASGRVGIGDRGVALIPDCAPCDSSPRCDAPTTGIFRCANDIVPGQIVDAAAKATKKPLRIQVREPATDVLAVLPFLSAGGGERSTLNVLRALERVAPGIRVAAVTTGRDGSSDAFRPAFAPYLQADITGNREYEVARLATLLNSLRPRSIVFYNNDLVVRALQTLTWRPESCVFVVHTAFAPGEQALLASADANAVVTRVIAVSEATAETIRSRGLLLAPKVVAVRNSVEPLERRDRDAIRAAVGIGPRDFVVGYLGRLDSGKGVDHVLAAARRASSEVTYLIVGWGPLADRATALAGRDNVRVVGPTTDVAPWFSAMDLCVLPTHTEGGVPYVVMECLSVGTPMAVTSVSDIPRLFTHRQDILVINPSVEAVESIVRWGVRHRPELQEIGWRGQELVRQEFSLDAMGQAYHEILLGAKP